MSFATMKSRSFDVILVFAFSIKFSLSAAKPTLMRFRPEIFPIMSGFLVKLIVKLSSSDFLILLVKTFSGFQSHTAAAMMTASASRHSSSNSAFISKALSTFLINIPTGSSNADGPVTKAT